MPQPPLVLWDWMSIVAGELTPESSGNALLQHTQHDYGLNSQVQYTVHPTAAEPSTAPAGQQPSLPLFEDSWDQGSSLADIASMTAVPPAGMPLQVRPATPAAAIIVVSLLFPEG